MDEHKNRPMIGDACPLCKTGTLGVYCSKVYRDRQLRARFLKCENEDCGHLPERNKMLIPLSQAPERRKRGSKRKQ